MKTLKEIKAYLKSLEKETIESKRGNIYEVVRVDDKLLNKIRTYKSIFTTVHIVNNTTIYPLKWYEGKNRIEIIVARKED